MKTVLPVITLFALISCQIEEKVPENAETEKVSRLADDTAEKDFDPQSMVGMPLEKAQKVCDERDLRHRVVEIDGQPQMVTRDYRPDRINFAVKEGNVTAVTTG